MRRWYQIIPENTGLSIYAWIIFCILPFYFLFRASSLSGIIFGLLMIVLFFTAYRISFLSKGWAVYLSIAVELIINIIMTIFIGYVYFALFLAFYIGNVQKKKKFITLYIIHLVTTLIAVIIGFFTKGDIFATQFPFIVLTVIGVSLLPPTLYQHNKNLNLARELEGARMKLAKYAILEERERIARDLHDVLGQKLSMIGLKSDLAKKLISQSPDLAMTEIDDIQMTARTALKEVRELVSHMKSQRIEDELIKIQQMLKLAHIDFEFKGDVDLEDTPPLVENVLSMCLKEAVTNIIKHSEASKCFVYIQKTAKELRMIIQDNGVGFSSQTPPINGIGLEGMKERLEFVNGTLMIALQKGTTITISIPSIIQETREASV